MKRRFAALALVLILIAGLLSGCSSSSAIDSKEARKGVVRVMSFSTRSIYSLETKKLVAQGTVVASGTAFGVGETGKTTTTFVTNRHVIGDEVGTGTMDGEPVYYQDKFESAYILKDDYAYDKNNGLDRSRATPCKILYRADSDEADLAVLQTADTLEDRMALPLLDKSYELEVGDKVIAIGYPGTTDDASDDTAGSVERATVTEGTVSVFRPIKDGGVDIDTIQHTATINHGNSGGPLITSTGEVAGVNTYGVGGGDGSGDTSTNNAIEIKYVTKVLDDLGIDYDVRKPASGSSAAIGGVVIVVAVVAVAAVVVVTKKKKPAPAAVAVSSKAVEQPVRNNIPPTSGGAPAASGAAAVPPPVPGDSGLRIQCTSGAFAGKRFAISKQMRIGRDPARNDLVFPADTQGVSGVHCVLVYQDNQLYLQDLGSTYGTFLGSGQRLAANQAVVLHIGDKFSLGSQKESFTVTAKGGV